MSDVLRRIGEGLVSFGSGIPKSQIDTIRAQRDIAEQTVESNQQAIEAADRKAQEDAEVQQLIGIAMSDRPDRDKALTRLFQVRPSLADQVFEGIGAIDQNKREDAARRAAEIQSASPELREQIIRRQAEELRAQGRNPKDTESLLSMTPEEQDQVLRFTQAAALSAKERLNLIEGTDIPAGQREFESLIQGMSPDDQKKARRIKAGLDPRAGVSAQERIALSQELTDLVAQSQAAITGEKSEAKAATARDQEFINQGIRQADATAVIRRGLELLKTIETGRPEAVALAARNLFGIAGADETELQANLGKAILSQLRTVFGAQFTEREGARLENIEANFGKSTEGNIRLLEQALREMERDARRGIDAATRAGDDFSVNEIQSALEFTLGDDNGVQTQEETDEERLKRLGF